MKKPKPFDSIIKKAKFNLDNNRKSKKHVLDFMFLFWKTKI